MDQLKSVHALLKLKVFIWKLSLVFGLTQLLFDHLLRARSERRKARTTRKSNIRLETCQQRALDVEGYYW